QEHENLQAEISSQINNAIANHIPSQDDLPIWLTLKYKYKKLHVSDTPCRPSVVRPRDQVDPHDDAYNKGENSEKRQKTTEHKTYVFGESSSGQVNESEPCPSMLGVKNVENAEVDSTTLRQNDNQIDPDTRLKPKGNKKSPKVEINTTKQHVNVIEEEEESTEDDYELRRREKGKHVEESRNKVHAKKEV
nr:hypothetical protein [Tanacetum cinerariifolium]